MTDVADGLRRTEDLTYSALHWGFIIAPLLAGAMAVPQSRGAVGWVWFVLVLLASLAGLVTTHTALRDEGSLRPSGWDRVHTRHRRPALIAWLALSVAALLFTPTTAEFGPFGGDAVSRILFVGALYGMVPGALATPMLALTKGYAKGIGLAVLFFALAFWRTVPEIEVSNMFQYGYVALGVAVIVAWYAGMFTLVLRNAAALDRARLDSARLAVAEERLRFSRDLHDVFGRTLSAVALKAELAAAQADRGRPEAADTMREVRRIAVDATEEVRSIVRGYRESDLDTEVDGARALLESAGIAVSTSIDAADLPAAVRRTLAWVVREGATNILRHANATTAAVALTRGPDGVRLDVRNDHPHAAQKEPGSGIAGLRERLAEVGGKLSTMQEDGWFVLRAEVDDATLARLRAAEGRA